MREIEAELLEEIQRVMRASGKSQADFAAKQGVTRQSVNPYFNGRRGLLTDTGCDLLEFLRVRIRLEPIDD